MSIMNLPGFSAEASLYRASWHFATAEATESAAGAIRLAQFEDPVECARCMRRCRPVRRFPSLFTDCVLANCYAVCGGIP